ncbi:hypothetical protein PAMP_021807 [Pampus punctatissimus]
MRQLKGGVNSRDRTECDFPPEGSLQHRSHLRASGRTKAGSAGSVMPHKLQKSGQTAHYIELGGYQYWPVLVPRGIRLYTYEQIPGFLRENPYITDGYRAYLPSRLCIKSLFILSNETVNIWSHLLGFLLFFCLGVYNMASVLPAFGASREDYVIYCIGLFCFQLCMLCSVGYHLFCCHRSEKTSRRWMALDYAGISIGILGCYVPGVFYTFYCNNCLAALLTLRFPPHIGSAELFCPQNATEICSSSNQMAAFTERSVTPVPHHMTIASLGAVSAKAATSPPLLPPTSSSLPRLGLRFWYWRQVYLVTVLAMILAVFFAQIHPHYLSKQWKQLRSLIFCSVAGYGLIPTVHWICITGGFSSELVQAFVPRVLGMYLIAALALIFYVSKVPERYFPGQLNYLGSSHQVWHLLLVLMFYWWHQSSCLIMAYRHSQPCPDAPQHT